MANVDVQFECLPLRSVRRFDVPWDAPDETRALAAAVQAAAAKHGRHNAYYLHQGRVVFHLTNEPQVGMIEFRFQGTLLTDPEDRRTRGSDLEVRLASETCDWLSQPAAEWLARTAIRAVEVEFDRFIAAGDLERTFQRLEQLQQQSDAQGGFLGMGL